MGKVKSKKRRRSSSSENSSSSSSSDSSHEKKKLRKLKKKLKKEQKKAEKALKKKLRDEKRKLKSEKKSRSKSTSCSRDESVKEVDDKTTDIPLALMEKSKAMAPMTKEEWEKRQSVVRRVLDEESGRYRLIKGDGEVLEEIVSRDRHIQINRAATLADGAFFQAQTVDKKHS